MRCVLTDGVCEIEGEDGRLGVESVGDGGTVHGVFFDDWENDLVCVVNLDDIHARITATPSQYKMAWSSRRLTS